MFGLFKSRAVVDPDLGELKHAWGYWRGTINLAGKGILLAVAGSRSAPDQLALAAAREVKAQFASWRPAIERALFEHYQPYAEAAAGEVDPDEEVPEISGPSDVWSTVDFEFVRVELLNGLLTAELGLASAWDKDHLLGARFQGGQLLELCGSTMAP